MTAVRVVNTITCVIATRSSPAARRADQYLLVMSGGMPIT